MTGIRADGEVAVLPRARLQPDARHCFVVEGAAEVERVRLDIFPDGGMARLRLWGRPLTGDLHPAVARLLVGPPAERR